MLAYSKFQHCIPYFGLLDSNATYFADFSQFFVFHNGIPYKKVRYIAQMQNKPNIDEIVQNPVKRVGIYMSASTHELAKKQYQEAGCKSVSDYISRAIHYYAELHSLNDCSNVLPDIITSTLKDITRESDNRQGRLLFKIAVELSILQNVLASQYGISPQEMNRVRGVCVNEVKKINGMITFEEAIRWQS